MNANEVIANLATKKARIKINPNDHVNMSQSSNDVIPTAICISALLDTQRLLMPALEHLIKTIDKKGLSLKGKVKTGQNTLNGCYAHRLCTRTFWLERSVASCT